MGRAKVRFHPNGSVRVPHGNRVEVKIAAGARRHAARLRAHGLGHRRKRGQRHLEDQSLMVVAVSPWHRVGTEISGPHEIGPWTMTEASLALLPDVGSPFVAGTRFDLASVGYTGAEYAPLRLPGFS